MPRSDRDGAREAARRAMLCEVDNVAQAIGAYQLHTFLMRQRRGSPGPAPASARGRSAARGARGRGDRGAGSRGSGRAHCDRGRRATRTRRAGPGSRQAASQAARWAARSAARRAPGWACVRSSIAVSSARRNGLDRKSSIPATRHASRSSAVALAVSAITSWRPAPAAARRRSSRVASKPSITGIWQSISTRSNDSRRAPRAPAGRRAHTSRCSRGRRASRR